MKNLYLLLFMFFVLDIGLLYSQTKVSGQVTSAEEKSPISFVTVLVKSHPQYYATTDEQGKYSLAVPNAQATLVFSLVGYQTKEVRINGQQVINTTLDTDTKTLDEVVVVAYGTARKSSFTGSISTLSAGDIKDVPVTSFENALSGRVPGLQITSSSGQAGSTAEIRIRGTGSMNAGNAPLYVIDGVPAVSGDFSQIGNVSNNVMNTLNPNDIENITVLKDAAAAALYGSRAANGVILITTKRGKVGKPRVNFRMNIGFTPSFATDNIEPASGEEMEELMYENYYNAAIDAGKTAAEADAAGKLQVNNRIPGDERGFFDWEDAYFRTGTYQDYDLSVSGATETSNYYTSINYTRDAGMVKTNLMDRYSGRLNLSQKIGKIAEIGTNVSLSNVKKDGFNDSRNLSTNYFLQTRNLLFPQWWPTKLLRDDTGNVIGEEAVTTRYLSYGYNNLYYDTQREVSSDILKLSAVETATIHFLPELQGKTIFSYDLTRTDDFIYYSPLHYNGTSTNGFVGDYSLKRLRLVSSSTLAYNKTFAKKHGLSLLIGYEVERNTTDYVSAEGTDLPNNTIKVISAAGTKNSNGYSTGYNLMSYLSKLDYNYDNKYYIAGSYRRDGSSRLGSNNRWGDFWSVSGSWRIINESFMEPLKGVLSNLRLRASYGVNGTLPDSNYGHLALYGFGYNYNESTGGGMESIANPDLSWESNYATNFAIESSFLDNRITFNVEYYNRTTKDLLQSVPISTITGFGSYLSNIGEMSNKGFEFELSADIIRTKDLVWDAGLSVSTLKSKVLKLYDGADVTWNDYTGGDATCQMIYREGYSPRSFYGVEYAGVNTENGKPMWFLNNETTDDLQVDGREATYTRSKAADVIFGNADPDLFGGLHTRLSYKGIALNMNLTYSLGGDTYDATAKDNADDGYYSTRVMTKYYYDHRWQNPGDVTDVPRRTYDQSSAQGYQSRNMHSGDYLRLKDISLSYTFNKELLRKIYTSNARVYVSASNLLTWAAYKEYDPEVNMNGVHTWRMPIAKTITFGLELDF